LNIKRFHLVLFLVILALLLSTTLYAGISRNDAFPDGGVKAEVVKVISPVELMVSEGGKEYKVKLLNLYLPEKKNSLLKLAKEEVERYILGDTVLLVYDEMKLDDDGTPIVLLYYAKEQYLLNADLVEKGYAFYQHLYPCQIKKELLDAQKKAKSYEAGMWSSGISSTGGDDGRYVSDKVEILVNENKSQKETIKKQGSKIVEQEVIIDELIYIIEQLVVTGESTEEIDDELQTLRDDDDEEILDEVDEGEIETNYLDDEIVRVEEIDIDELNYEKIKNKLQKKIDEVNEKLETATDPKIIEQLLQERDRLWEEFENIEEIEMIEKKFKEVSDDVYSEEDIEETLETIVVEEELEDVEDFIQDNSKVVEDLETYIEETSDDSEEVIDEGLEGIENYIDGKIDTDEVDNNLGDYKEKIDEIIKDDNFVDINEFIYDDTTGVERVDTAELVLNWANAVFSFDTGELSEGIEYFKNTYDIDFYKLLLGYEYSLTENDSLIFDNCQKLSGLASNFKNLIDKENDFLLVVEGNYSDYSLVETNRINNEGYYKSHWYISIYQYNDDVLIIGSDRIIQTFIQYVDVLKEEKQTVFHSLLTKSPVYKMITEKKNIDIGDMDNWLFIDNTDKKLFDDDIASPEKSLPEGIGTLFLDYDYANNNNKIQIEVGSMSAGADNKVQLLIKNWLGIMSLFSLKSSNVSALLDKIEIEKDGEDSLSINAEFSSEEFNSFLKDISMR
jgi:endonuclease YncB( thermonuclease family)